MNKITRIEDIVMPKVTTGPVSASRKVYSSPERHDDIRVPLREIALTDPAEPAFRVYDPSGPYTDQAAEIDVTKGLPRVRDAWVHERGGVEAYDGREIKPEDNGNVAGAHAARVFPIVHRPLRATPPLPQGQREGAPGGGAATASASVIPTPHATPTPDPSPQGGRDPRFATESDRLTGDG